jgi:hypothetical protein
MGRPYVSGSTIQRKGARPRNATLSMFVAGALGNIHPTNVEVREHLTLQATLLD